jgi:predicted nucleotidyltransferase
VERTELIEALLGLGTPQRMMQHLPDLAQVEGLLMYGSRARGDSVPGSDLDLLAVVEAARPSWHEGDVNVSYYTREQLATGIGTLFGAHLKRDAIVLWDGDGRTAAALEAMVDVDTERLIRRARDMSQLFTTLDEDLPRYLPGLLREARYLLRSCLYAQAIVDDRPCFSVRELAVRHGDPELASLLASRHAIEPSIDDLDRCLERLGSIIGVFPPSRNGSLEATIVNEWDQPGDLLSMAFLALGVTGKGSDYADVEKILL